MAPFPQPERERELQGTMAHEMLNVYSKEIRIEIKFSEAFLKLYEKVLLINQ